MAFVVPGSRGTRTQISNHLPNPQTGDNQYQVKTRSENKLGNKSCLLVAFHFFKPNKVIDFYVSVSSARELGSGSNARGGGEFQGEEVGGELWGRAPGPCCWGLCFSGGSDPVPAVAATLQGREEGGFYKCHLLRWTK